jgi:hypothetical protein
MNWAVEIQTTGLDQKNLGDLLKALGYRMTDGPEGLVFSSDEMSRCTAAADVFELAKKIRSAICGPSNVDDKFQLGRVVDYSCYPPIRHVFLEVAGGVCHATGLSASITIGPPEGLCEEELAAWHREQEKRNYQARLQKQLERLIPAYTSERASKLLELLDLKEHTGVSLYKIYELAEGHPNNRSTFLEQFGIPKSEFNRFKDAIHNPAVTGDWARHAYLDDPKTNNPMSKAEAEAFVLGLADKWLKSLM